MIRTDRLSPVPPRVKRALPAAFRFAAVVLGMAAAGSAKVSAAPDLFDELHARVRALEEKRQTIRARFTETTVSSLLVKPMVSVGTLIGAKPASLAMTYTSPERRTVVLDGRHMLITRPALGERELVDITEIVKRVDHYFVDATPDELRRHFTVRAFVDPEIPAWYQIDLVPTRKQIRQGLERLQIWIARDTLLLAQIRITFAGGDTTTVTIKDAELNVPLPADAFTIDVPPAKPK
jgi:outer membrane lipoprotein-sorting protein